MYWTDEGYLLSKNNFGENSIIIEAFTLKHGRYTGIVYGGSSRKQKSNFQIGNKILLNWRSKGSFIGGIYNRPIAMANLTHFVIAGLALIKGVLANPSLSYVIWSIAIIYSIFAILFGIVAFKHPVSENNIDNQTSSEEEE